MPRSKYVCYSQPNVNRICTLYIIFGGRAALPDLVRCSVTVIISFSGNSDTCGAFAGVDCRATFLTNSAFPNFF